MKNNERYTYVARTRDQLGEGLTPQTLAAGKVHSPDRVFGRR